MLRLKYVIAIDGPAGAGKSSTAYRLAKSLNYLFIDSGAIYRAITYKWLKEDRCQINKLLNLLSLDLKLPWYNPQKIKLYIDKENISRHLRDEEVEANVSYIARQPEVRRFVTDYLQRKIRNILKYKGIVIEGRDIGTVVYKEADIKFYLDASLTERAKRRLKQNKTKLINYDKVYQDIKLRDLADMTRPLGKLKKANDAWYINTTHLKLKEVVKVLKDKVKALKKIDNHTFIYNTLHLIAWILFRIFFFIEVKGIENFPTSKGTLLICNHLSYLDPPIIGACAIRRLNYIARNSLFTKNKLFTFIIKKLNAIPIKQTGFDKQALKNILNLLSLGKVVVLFPEGTRSLDGRLQPFKLGVGFIIKKVKELNLPIKILLARIYGTEKALPKGKRFIRLFTKIKVEFAKCILPSEIPFEDEKSITSYLYHVFP